MQLNDVPYIKAVRVTDPGAGVEWSLTGPGQGLWRVVALQALFTASAAVANRLPSLVLTTSDGDMARATVPVAVTANQAVPVSSFPGAPSSGVAGGPMTIPAPTDGWLLLPGMQLRSLVGAIDAGDAWSLIRALVVEYPTGPTQRFTPDLYTIAEPS